ncbi:SET domain-containing protein [Butyriboletus roseoflavus]|nr:SET domain-containing protein [Butyriboletus roseoflavus]
MMEGADIDAFVRWFQSNGGYIDTKAMGITEYPGSGRGAIALCDIPVCAFQSVPKGYTLFTLPRTITLSTRTSPLPSLFGFNAWRAHGLHKGWVGLILCMMWEDAWAHESDAMDRGAQGQHDVQTKWGPYMRTLPTTFDTPMFWSAEELEELQGTAVIDKIGRDDVARAYSEQLVPAINTSPALFPPSHHGDWYTLDAYHRAGSRILSRSFTVNRWTDNDEVEEDRNCHGEAGEAGSDADDAEDPHSNTSIESSMHIDDARTHPSLLEDTDERLDSDSEDSEDDDPSDVAMVPMADILNARWGSENAKLFYEPFVLRMVTTKNIKQGEQIFNTYGDPPNSELLRRYGHVDLVRLHSSSSTPIPDRHGDVEMKGDTDVETVMHLGNPSDIVEVRADLVLHVVQTTNFGSKAKDTHARIEWWLDEGEDDTFVLTLPESGSHSSAILPPALISLTRLLLLSEPDFESAHSKGRLPKGKLRKVDVNDNKEVLEILDDVFKQREEMYIGGSIEDDERLLSVAETLTRRKRHAVIVRLGEKRILRDIRQTLRAMLAELGTTSINGAGHGDEKGNRRDRVGDSGKEAGGNRKRVIKDSEGDRGWKKARKR